MTGTIELAEIGRMVGEPARAAMLIALMDGRALTAGELAFAARVSPQTASEHLRQLSDVQLLAVLKQGRHRYFRLASPLVAQMIESMGIVAAVQVPPRHRPASAADAATRAARMCYDHLAGRLAVDIAGRLVAEGFLVLSAEGGEMTPAGYAFLERIGVALPDAAITRRAFCRPCLDWSERRFHIAGHVGAALAHHCLDQGWIARVKDSRAVRVTDLGRNAFGNLFAIRFADSAKAA
jgi:DNA-binding transcriptional ArsR family regulator